MIVERSNQASWVARKRARARAGGFCATCCRRRPPSPSRKICEACALAAYHRTKRLRGSKKKDAEAQYIIVAHEHAGDIAREHHLYNDAAQHYQDALNVPRIAENDGARISEKLAYALSLGRSPQAASPLFDRALVNYLGGRRIARRRLKFCCSELGSCGWI